MSGKNEYCYSEFLYNCGTNDRNVSVKKTAPKDNYALLNLYIQIIALLEIELK